MLKNFLLFVFALTYTSTTIALEPLKDRAIVTNMNADLLLPDGSSINVDVSFDCSSEFHNAAIMVMSDAGAQLVAAAYTTLFGLNAGKAVMKAWETKKHENDPRKPTYLFVLTPRNKSFNWRNIKTNDINKSLTYDSIVNNPESLDSGKAMPMIEVGCGGRVHDPLIAN